MIYSAVSNASDAFIEANPGRASDGFESLYGVAFRHWLLREADAPADIWEQLRPGSHQVRYPTKGFINEQYRREITSRPDKYFYIKNKVLPSFSGEFRSEDIYERAQEQNRDFTKNVTLLGLQRAITAWIAEGIIERTREDKYHVKYYKRIVKDEQQILEAF